MPITKNRDQVAYKLGMAGLYILAASAWTFTIGVDVGLILMLVGTLVKPKLYPAIWQQGMGRVLAIFAICIVASGIWASIEFPPSASPQTTAMYRWSKLLLFFLPAWWLCQDRQAAARVFFISLFGLLVMILLNVNWANLLTFNITLERSGFGLADPNEIAFSCCVYLLFLGLYTPRLFQDVYAGKTRRYWFGLWAVCLWVLSYVLLSSLSRQAWLAFAIVALPLILLRYIMWLKGNLAVPKLKFAALLLVSVLALIVFAANNRDSLAYRFSQENIANSNLHEIDGKTICYTSVACRVGMIKFGFEKWLERPIFGWGIGSTQYVAKSSQDRRMWIVQPTPGVQKYYVNMHNTYVEILLRMGLVGALGWMGLFLAINHILVKEYRQSCIQLDTFLFLLGLGLMMLVIGWFSFYVGSNRGCAYWLLLAGEVYSLQLKRSSSP